ncbi:MAG: ROK family protein [Pirellulaceae bacterium]|nr:ROK family protein [Pirellulaceae bacterium]
MPTLTTTAVAARRPLFLGFDVGGTNIKLGVVDDQGHSVAHTKIPTREEQGPREAVRRAKVAVEEMLAGIGLGMHDLAAIGLATPGTMDIPRGMFLQPHNLPHWHYFPIKQEVADVFGLPTTYANDANAAAYGEFWVGTGQKFHSIVLLTLGTGVGGGIIIGDLSVDGENSHGSECGHIIVDNSPTARMCGCGQPGHLEAYCSATALVKRTHELLAGGRASSLTGRITDATPLTALMISQEADRGDALASEVIFELGTWLGLGCVTLMHTIDPGAMILGGAVNFGGTKDPIGNRFIEHVRSVVRKHAFPILAQRTVIEFADLGGDAGYIGAAGIARLDYHRRHPAAKP